MVDHAEIEVEDVEDALKRAGELADLTGRKKTDIVADLLDDGQLNYSAGTDAEVKKDILDVAQEKAEKLKTLLTTLIPVFALVMGIGAEGLGFVDLTGWGSDSMWEDDPNNPNSPNMIYWGCTDYNALNYDVGANEDDGSCSYEPPDCEHDWQYDDHSRLEGNTIVVDQILGDDAGCDDFGEGYFEIILKENGQEYRLETIHSGLWRHSYMVEHEFEDVESGTYRLHVMYLPEGGDDIENPDVPTFTVENEGEDCVPDLNYYDLNLGADSNSLTLYVDFQDENGCENTDLEMRAELFWNGGSYHFMDWGSHGGLEPISDSEVNYELQEDFMTGLNDGEWYMEWSARVVNNDNSDFEVEEQTNTITIDEIPDGCADDDEDGVCNEDEVEGCTDENAENHNTEATDDDGSCTYEPEVCEINLYWVDILTNATHATVGYDLDCGYEVNDLEGYNVSVQFLVYEVNGTSGGPNATGPIIYDTDLHFIQGWVEDNNFITITNFTESNATHYDFYFYAIWVDGNDENQMIEHEWLNREVNP